MIIVSMISNDNMLFSPFFIYKPAIAVVSFKLCIMNSSIPFDNLQYGYGFIGQNKTFKARYKAQLADLILEHIPKQYHIIVKTHKTKNEYCFIGLMAHHSHIVWTIFERAVIQAKGQLLSIED